MQAIRYRIIDGISSAISYYRSGLSQNAVKPRRMNRTRLFSNFQEEMELESRVVMTATLIGLNIAGVSNNNLAPPDTMGSIGPNHYVQFLNGSFSIYNRSTGANLVSKTDTAFW